MILHIRDLEVHFGKTPALRGISLHVEKGEIVALIGANGAGKSTTLNTICGVVRATSGQVILEDRDITNLAVHEIVRLGVSQVPEGRRVFPRMSVQENLLMGAFLRKDKVQDRMDVVFSLFPRLRERLKQAAGTLSGGEQQMLVIGRALLSEPKLLLLDEPSMGLAPILVEEVFRVLRDINSLGISVLLVEQNARMALKTAARAYVLETGNIVLEGKAKDLLADPRVEKAYLGL